MKADDIKTVKAVRELLNSALTKSYDSDCILTIELDRLIARAIEEADNLIDTGVMGGIEE